MDKILLSIAYFPPIDYFHFLSSVDHILMEAHETYTKQTYRNRCNIFSPNGIQALIIPIKKVDGNHTKTINIQISDHSNWRLHHWKSLQTAYNTSAFFMFYKDELWKIMQFQANNLLEYNLHLLNFLMNEIGIKTKIELTNQFVQQTSNIRDLRASINPKNKTSMINLSDYYQVYNEKHGFIPNLSILDLLFNEGPNTLNYLHSLKMK